jgi:protein involved in polysaccharide export with SLBB domain
MPLRSRLLPFLVVLTASVASLTSADHAGAQTSGSSPSDAELQILQGLTPEQRDAISQQLGSTGSLSGLGGTGTGTQNPLGRPQTEEERQQIEQLRVRPEDIEARRAEIERLSPYLAAEDWVVITIDSSPLPPPTLSPSQQLGLQGLAGNTGLPQNTQAPSPMYPYPVPQQGTTGNPAAGVDLRNQTNPLAGESTAGGYTPPPLETPVQPLGAQNPAQTRPPLTDEEKRQRATLIDLIRSKNPYEIARDGTLNLPGFAPIPLAGLTETLATLRLGVEPALRDLFIRVTKLPLKKSGPTTLKPFGYELFDRQISTFAPSTNVPVPSNYVVGAGDELDVQLYGNQNRNLRLIVGRDGLIRFPELGPISVAGQTYDRVKEDIEARVERQMIGVRASVSMGDTRTIRVFVLGDARRPGSYIVSGLATITSALFAAGGVQTIGSLRNIQLKRRGEVVRRLDLYDMLIRGDTTDDEKLLPDDTIFIPPIGPTVTVDGEVHRPAIYETRNEKSIAQVVQLAGGLTPEADRSKAALTRIQPDLERVVLQVDLTGNRTETVRNGDLLHISRLRPTLSAGVQVDGYVYATGAFEYHQGMRLTDIIRTVDDLKPNADLHYILIRRELPPDNRVAVLSADLVAALAAPGSTADIPLFPRDRLTVFDLQSSRDRVIQPLLSDLRLQSTISRPDAIVRIEGRANVPGEYPLETNMTVRDLLRAGGGLSDAAYGGTAELTRYQIVNGESREVQLLPVDLAAVLRGDQAANLHLQPFDTLSIKEVTAWSEHDAIILRGEVKFPGTYPIKQGETLKSVLTRAGGLTQYAFARGSVFTRVELREREQRQLDSLAVRMQNDITMVALQGAAANQSGAATALSVGQSLMVQLRETRAVGRLVIDLPRLMKDPVGSPADVVLREGDQLIVPKFQQEVTVIGEVQNATSHLYVHGLSRDDYINMSGGATRRADWGRIYLVRADGSVIADQGARWFHGGSNTEVRPGDTIVVPLNAEHMPPLPLWQAVTQIIYNVAIAAAAVHSF